MSMKFHQLETDLHEECMCPGNCPPGYIERSGDVSGKGSIPHKKEWGLDAIEECASNCDQRIQCHSFLFDKPRILTFIRQNQCKLMNDVLPTDPPHGNAIFCVKCNLHFELLS